MNKVEMQVITPRVPKLLIKRVDEIVFKINQKYNLTGNDRMTRNKVLFKMILKECANYEVTGELD